MTTVGERIAELRVKRGISQAQLGRAVGYSAPMISAIEGGHRKADLERLEKIARALGVNPRALAFAAGEDDYARGYQDGWTAGLLHARDIVNSVIEDGK